MSRKRKTKRIPHSVAPKTTQHELQASYHAVSSLLDNMIDGNEYGSIVSLAPGEGLDFKKELTRAISEIETIRNRPCLCYAANLIKEKIPHTSIEEGDHLPFNEAVSLVPASEKGVDVFLATPGGSAEQVNLFVEALRQRFEDVQFIVPYKAMSAGTLWALSGDEIWMDRRAFLGPIDPQVPTRDGIYAPAQGLLVLLEHIRREGTAALQRQQQPDWAYRFLLQNLDQTKLGQALTSSHYVIAIAAQFLERYKFKSWSTHSSTGLSVTQDERKKRATEIATELCSHDRWKAHGHAISRKVMEEELRIRISHLETAPELEKAVRRAWAVLYYLFDKAPVAKVILSRQYSYFRFGREG